MIIISHDDGQVILNNACSGYEIDTSDLENITINFHFSDNEIMYLYFDDIEEAKNAIAKLNRELSTIVYNSGIVNVIYV